MQSAFPCECDGTCDPSNALPGRFEAAADGSLDVGDSGRGHMAWPQPQNPQWNLKGTTDRFCNVRVAFKVDWVFGGTWAGRICAVLCGQWLRLGGISEGFSLMQDVRDLGVD